MKIVNKMGVFSIFQCTFLMCIDFRKIPLDPKLPYGIKFKILKGVYEEKSTAGAESAFKRHFRGNFPTLHRIMKLVLYYYKDMSAK